MSLYCDDGSTAQITPWVPVPPLAKGETKPRILEPERDRCSLCGKVAWRHWITPPVSAVALEAIGRIVQR